MASITAPTQSVAFNPESFVGSTAYNFIRDQGMDAINRSAQSRGTLLTGGTLKDLMRFGQGNASTFWGNQLDHDYRMAALNSGIMEGNAGRTLSGLGMLGGWGMGAAGGMAGGYGNYGMAGAGGTVGQQSAWNQGLAGMANTLGGYLAGRRGQQPPASQSSPYRTPPFVPDPNAGMW